MTLKKFLDTSLNSFDTIYELYDFNTEEVFHKGAFISIYPLFYRYKIKWHEVDFENKIIRIGLKRG